MPVGTSVERSGDLSSREDRSGFLQPPGRVLVEQTRDQRLVRQSLLNGALLDCFEVLARDADVQPAILAKRCPGITGIAVSHSLGALDGSPFSALDRFD